MSDSDQKEKRSKRLQQEENAIRRQAKIGRAHNGLSPKEEKEPHRFAKSHALNCGDPNCMMCGNPRKFFKERTIQEKSFDQKKYHEES